MADINIEEVTNSQDTGIFDKLMSSVNKNKVYFKNNQHILRIGNERNN
jgi:hypothetical protein